MNGNATTAARPLCLAPGPRGLPFLGQLFQFQRDPLRFLLNLSTTYGPVAHFRIGPRVVTQIGEPELIQEVLVGNSRNFKKSGFLERVRPLLGNGLVNAEGDFHLRQRRLMQPAFSRQKVHALGDTVVHVTRQYSERWQHGQQLDMFQEMLRVALRIVTRTLFGSDDDFDIDAVERSLTTVIDHVTWLLSPLSRLQARLPLPANRRFEAAVKYLDSVVAAIIERRRQRGSDSDDILSLLLSARDVEGDGTGMSDRQVRDEVMTLFTAGHETVATALTWSWYALATNPDVYDRLAAEIEIALGERPPTASDIPNLRYVEMVFAESMRLFPPVWAITRTAVQDCQLGEYDIPAGSLIGMSQYVVHRDPRFFPEPQRFDPSRWTTENRASRPRYSYFPFGGGLRVCIGEAFAWQEGVLVLASLCQRWRPALPGGHSVSFHPTITLRPRHGMPMILEDRQQTRKSQPAAQLCQEMLNT